MTIPELRCETDDWFPAPITIDGVNVITRVSYRVTSLDARPTVLLAAVARDVCMGIKARGMIPGLHNVYVKIAAPPGAPVIGMGMFRIVWLPPTAMLDALL